MSNYYRRNSDEDIRNLENKLKIREEDVVDNYIRALYRMGQMHTPIGFDAERRKKVIDNDLATAQALFTSPLFNGPDLVLEFCKLDPPESFNVAALFTIDPVFAVRYMEDPYEDFRSQRGKFDTVLDSLIYQLDDEDFYSNENWGSNAHLHTFSGEDLKYLNELSLEETKKSLTSAEMIEIIGSAGAILYESSDGGVTVSFYNSNADLRKAWEELAEDFPNDEGEEVLGGEGN